MKRVYVLCLVSLIFILFILIFLDSCILDPKKDPNFTLEPLSEISATASINSGVELQLSLKNKDDESHTLSVKVSSSLGIDAKDNLKDTFTLKGKTKADFWVKLNIPNDPSLIGKTEETKVWAVHSEGKKSQVVTFYTKIVSPFSNIKFIQNVVTVSKHEQFNSLSGWVPGTWNGNKFTGSWNFQQYGNQYSGTVLAEYDATTNTLKKFVWSETKHGYKKLSYELKDLTFDHYYDFSTYNLVFKETGTQIKNHVVSYARTTYNTDGSSYTSNTTSFSDNSELVIWFSKE